MHGRVERKVQRGGGRVQILRVSKKMVIMALMVLMILKKNQLGGHNQEQYLYLYVLFHLLLLPLLNDTLHSINHGMRMLKVDSIDAWQGRDESTEGWREGADS